jgi:hypothetical protein
MTGIFMGFVLVAYAINYPLLHNAPLNLIACAIIGMTWCIAFDIKHFMGK